MRSIGFRGWVSREITTFMGHANFACLTDDLGDILGVFDGRGNQSLELKRIGSKFTRGIIGYEVGT